MDAQRIGPTAGLLLLAAAAGAQEWAPPSTLQETGLYSDWATKTIREDTLSYTPQYPLWSDGAAKRRHIQLPKATWIDASDPDAWRFPVGTKLWKEFLTDADLKSVFAYLRTIPAVRNRVPDPLPPAGAPN